MSDFLKLWDKAIAKAIEVGEPVYVHRTERALYEDNPAVDVDSEIIARTMHPSFMAAPAPKHHPERDQ